MIICPKCNAPILLSHSSRINCECGAHFDEQGGILLFAGDYEEFFADHTKESVSILEKSATEHFWLLERKRWVMRAVTRYLGISDQFLDVGVGGCDIAIGLRDKGIDVTLADIQKESLEIGAKLGFEHLFQFNLYEPVFKDHFQGVGVFDVLEHLDDDALAIKNLLQMISPGGFVFATVPAFNFLWNNRDNMEMHKRRYSRRQFVDLFQSQGADVVSCTYIFSFIFPLLLIRAMQSWLAPRTEFSEADQLQQFSIGSMVNKALKLATKVERKIFRQRSLPFGGSLLLIARRGY